MGLNEAIGEVNLLLDSSWYVLDKKVSEIKGIVVN